MSGIFFIIFIHLLPLQSKFKFLFGLGHICQNLNLRCNFCSKDNNNASIIPRTKDVKKDMY